MCMKYSVALLSEPLRLDESLPMIGRIRSDDRKNIKSSYFEQTIGDVVLHARIEDRTVFSIVKKMPGGKEQCILLPSDEQRASCRTHRCCLPNGRYIDSTTDTVDSSNGTLARVREMLAAS